ncbi:MAG: class I SAM-dependent methyltransferase [Spirochaetaceae bacterium]|nr:MAG: class I SAM-dependent methyltransferase [Spirochaetaceae bacterium]
MDTIFYKIFETMPRLGPGSTDATLEALSHTAYPHENAMVLDLGCGTGVQTMVLAQKITGTILALDNYQPFLDQIAVKASDNRLQARVKPVLRDMHDFCFQQESFDLIWSEGAIYIIGFASGLVKARGLLKEGGFAMFSDMNWFLPDPVEELVEFFRTECPEMMSVEANVELIAKSGFELVHKLRLPDIDFWQPYYAPLEKRLELFREQYRTDSNVLGLVATIQHEIDLYRKYSAYYGYTYYVMKKS